MICGKVRFLGVTKTMCYKETCNVKLFFLLITGSSYALVSPDITFTILLNILKKQHELNKLKSDSISMLLFYNFYSSIFIIHLFILLIILNTHISRLKPSVIRGLETVFCETPKFVPTSLGVFSVTVKLRKKYIEQSHQINQKACQ